MTLARRALLRGGGAAAALTLAGCAALESPQAARLRRTPPPGLPRRIELADTPFFAQTEHHCGPAALATVLVASGADVSPQALAPQVYLPSREGSLQIEMLAAARRHDRLAVRLPPQLDALLRELAGGRAVVVLQNLGLAIAPRWHYAVAIGHDLDAGRVLLRSGITRREAMDLSTFDHTWARSGRWCCAVSDPPALPLSAAEDAVSEACVAFERVARPERALAAYEGALARWPHSLTLAMGRGNSLHASGRKAEAAQAFEQAARAHGSAAAWINLGEVALELGQPAQALHAAQQAAQYAARPGDPFAARAGDLLRRAQAAAR